MTVLQDSKEIFIDETERKPNLYATNVLSEVLLVIAIVCAMNELNIFTLNEHLVRTCFLVSLSLLLVMQIIVHKPSLVVHPASKYAIMAIVLFLVLTVTVLLNINAVLAFVLPLLIATQYRSNHISHLALSGSCLCCGISPILSYLLGTWDLRFMTGLIETFCRITIDVAPLNDINNIDAIKRITLYWSLPQMLTIAAFGLILHKATKSGIDSVHNQMQVADLSNNLYQQSNSLMSIQEKVLYSMSDIIENRDLETGGHVRRTSEIVRLLMDSMRKDPKNNISDTFYNNVIKSAPMHDFGKIAIPDSILRKPDKLTEEEYEMVKMHPIKSAEIIEKALTGIEDEELLTTAKNIAKYHHERMDGTGYPEQLKGKDIPLEARIMAIADVYDALVSKRCYKESMAFDEAFKLIEELMGTQFDPDLFPYFVSCRQSIEEYYKI